jgi:hypothetical protein
VSAEYTPGIAIFGHFRPALVGLYRHELFELKKRLALL